MMLFTRNIGEAIEIGNTIKVIHLGIKGNQVCLGITAPSNVNIRRQEVLFERKQATSVSIVKKNKKIKKTRQEELYNEDK